MKKSIGIIYIIFAVGFSFSSSAVTIQVHSDRVGEMRLLFNDNYKASRFPTVGHLKKFFKNGDYKSVKTVRLFNGFEEIKNMALRTADVNYAITIYLYYY